MMKVLVASRSQTLPEAIASILKLRWPDLALVHADEATASPELVHREQPDIVMFHLPEPSEVGSSTDCFRIISQIHNFSRVPLIVISKNTDVMDKVKALEMGADDWLSPSAIPMEFLAKVTAILRRRSADYREVASFRNGKVSINYDTRQVSIAGKRVKLTPIQYKLLCHLMENLGRVCSSTELLQHVWGPNYGDEKELLKLSVYRLRSKIEEDPSNPEIIFNERGVGYFIRPLGSSW